MKSSICNNRGAVYVGIILILLIVLVLSASLLNILTNNRSIAINSTNDGYRANYILESVLELKIEKIMELCDWVVDSYLIDLQTYNIEHIKNAGNIPYNPPDFYNYIKGLDSNIKNLSESTNNPFEEYKEKHYYKVDIECDTSENCISIISRGEYRQARKFINVELELPTITNEGVDEYGLPKISISSVKITRYYQTFGL